MKDQKKIRDSNIELLRIISIIFIIMHHYSIHNNLCDLELNNINKYIGIVTLGLGKVGVNIFILIMGYFTIEKKISVKKVLKLWLQVFFYSFGIAIIFKFIQNANFSIKDWISYIFPISYTKYWFITAYMLLYILTPWINDYFTKINKEKYKKLLILLSVIIILFYNILYKSLAYSMDEFMPYSNIITFLFLYLLGGYIKKYDISMLKRMSQRKMILYIFITFIFFYVFLTVCEIIDIKYNRLGDALYWYTRQTSIFVFILSVLIFYFFKNLRMKNYKIINTLARGAFGVYLIQSHTFTGGRNLYVKWINTTSFINSRFLIIQLLVATLGIYIVGSIIDLLRINIIEKKIFKIKKLDNLFEKIEKKVFIDN